MTRTISTSARPGPFKFGEVRRWSNWTGTDETAVVLFYGILGSADEDGEKGLVGSYIDSRGMRARFSGGKIINERWTNPSTTKSMGSWLEVE